MIDMLPSQQFDTKLYPRIVDFLPNISLQALVSPKAEYSYGELVATTGVNRIKFDPVITEYGEVMLDSTDKTKIHYFFGDPTPTKTPDTRLSTKAILSDLTTYLADGFQECFADAVLQEFHVLESIPKSLADNEKFGCIDEVKFCQKACGNHNKKYGKFMGMNFIDPYQHARMGLMSNCNVRLNHNLATRIRSTEVTTTMCGIDGNRAIDYKTYGIDAITTLEKHITQKRWWQDMATFFPFPHYDYIYCLNRERKYMPISTE